MRSMRNNWPVLSSWEGISLSGLQAFSKITSAARVKKDGVVRGNSTCKQGDCS